MSDKKTIKSAQPDDSTYFSYFNHKLYDNPIYLQDEELSTKSNFKLQTIEEEELSAYSHINITSIDKEDNEENKYIPLNLLNLSPTKQSFISQELSTSNNSPKNDDEKKVNKSPIKEIKPELQKYILPKSLFNSSKNKNYEEDEKDKNNDIVSQNSSSPSNKINQINIFSEPFNPKYNIIPFIVINNPSYFYNNTKFDPKNNNYNSNKNKEYKEYKEYTHNEKKKKKKNKEFVEREGDWPCYRCKNINFAFRNKCNKCKMLKEESEIKFVKAGEELLKLADLSIYNKVKDKLD